MDRWLLRSGVALAALLVGLLFRPFADARLGAASERVLDLSVGAIIAAGLFVLERRVEESDPVRVLGGIAGAGAGALAGAALGRAIPRELGVGPLSLDFARPLLALALAWAGLLSGARAAARFVPLRRATAPASDPRAGGAARSTRPTRLFDTSVIIDGRIADVIETGFLDGTILVPTFVLSELQQVANSSDSLRRARGRKGLEVLARIQQIASVEVVFPDEEFPGIHEIDLKLIESARNAGASLVTNDFNLNKQARLRGIPVLNLNDLANAVKPVILPGESMRVFVLKEGKEPNQGVAYLDDGTMVVIDQARKNIGKTVEVTITSVLQTTAGKMFFGRLATEG